MVKRKRGVLLRAGSGVAVAALMLVKHKGKISAVPDFFAVIHGFKLTRGKGAENIAGFFCLKMENAVLVYVNHIFSSD